MTARDSGVVFSGLSRLHEPFKASTFVLIRALSLEKHTPVDVHGLGITFFSRLAIKIERPFQVNRLPHPIVSSVALCLEAPNQ